MMPETTRCVECGRDLPPPAGRGRRRHFCDATCRSAARRRRAGTTPATCELAVGGHVCPHPADGEVHLPRPPARVRVCGGHRPVAEALLSELYPAGARWCPYQMSARGHDDADMYRLRYTDNDSWELLRADTVIAGHEGFDAQDVTAAQAWAVTELFDAHGVRVLDWTTSADTGQEHVVTLARPTDDPDGDDPLVRTVSPAANQQVLEATQTFF